MSAPPFDKEPDFKATSVNYDLAALLWLVRSAGASLMHPPVYFEEVRKRAAQRWDQLENDPDLAAPWHQLFKQVQSPRHVVSELLQNADDAGAPKANVLVDGDEFIFSPAMVRISSSSTSHSRCAGLVTLTNVRCTRLDFGASDSRAAPLASETRFGSTRQHYPWPFAESASPNRIG